MDFTYEFDGKEIDAVTESDEVVKYAIATIKAQELYPDDRNKRDIAFKVLLSFLNELEDIKEIEDNYYYDLEDYFEFEAENRYQDNPEEDYFVLTDNVIN